ncbi:hypothetical protein Tco_1202132, partial [Tanacetum coccineum]
VAKKGDKCEEMEAAKEKNGCGEEMAIAEVDAWFQMVFANDGALYGESGAMYGERNACKAAIQTHARKISASQGAKEAG